jgi:hypothetical protein
MDDILDEDDDISINIDNSYDDFYKDDNYYVPIHYIYMNNQNEIQAIKKDIFLMSKPNYILKNELLELIYKYSVLEKQKYTLSSILQYNITLEPENVTYFLKQKECSDDYLSIFQQMDDIKLKPTIHMFQDLNNLYIFFSEKNNLNKTRKNIEYKNKTKKYKY